MIRITPINCTSLKPAVSFAARNKAEEQDFEDGFTKFDEENAAKKLEDLAEKLSKESKKPSTGKVLGIQTALVGAAVLTSTALAGKGFNAAHELIPALSRFCGKANRGFAKIADIVATKAEKGEGIKNKFFKYTDKAFVWFKKVRNYGVEKELKEIAKDRADDIKTIRQSISKKIRKENPEITADALKQAINSDSAYIEKVKEFENKKDMVQGANLFKKGTKTAAGASAVVISGEKVTNDADGDGVPNCAQKEGAHKSATEQITRAVIDIALDNAS